MCLKTSVLLIRDLIECICKKGNGPDNNDTSIMLHYNILFIMNYTNLLTLSSEVNIFGILIIKQRIVKVNLNVVPFFAYI